MKGEITMIIVSQDNKNICNFENTIGIQIDEHITNNDGEKDYEIKVITEKRECIVGVYETEERAKEISKEISQRYTNWENLKVGQPSGICSPRYEMPEE